MGRNNEIDIGQKHGRLTVKEYIGLTGKRQRTFRCVCDCGGEIIRNASILKSKGEKNSCGCLGRETIANMQYKHGESKTRLYRIWAGIHTRCKNKNSTHYSLYGGRGITMYPEWEKSYENFKTWATRAGYKDNLTIERIDNNKGYYPQNCLWIPKSEQSKNRRCCRFITYNGCRKTISDWARHFNVDYEQLRVNLVNKKMEMGDAVIATTRQFKEKRIRA